MKGIPPAPPPHILQALGWKGQGLIAAASDGVHGEGGSSSSSSGSNRGG